MSVALVTAQAARSLDADLPLLSAALARLGVSSEVVVWDDPAAPLSGKFTVFGIRVGVSYRVTVYVTDAATGALVGQQSIFAGASRKVGV